MTRGSELRWLRRRAPGTLGGRSEQATPAPSRPRAPTSPVGAPGQRAATLLVAASNASDRTKASADFICDGSGDEVEINAAMALAASLNRPGIVQLSEGGFSRNADINLVDDLWLRGAGAGGTHLDGSGDIVLSGVSYIKLSDFELNTDVIVDGVSDLRMHELEVGGAVYSNTFSVDDFWMTSCAIFGAGPNGYSLDLAQDPSYLFVVGNLIDEGIRIVGGAGGSDRAFAPVIANNECEGDIYLQKFKYGNVTGNIAYGMTLDACGVASRSVLVNGNVLQADVLIDASQWVLFDGNIVEGFASDAIVVQDSSDCTVSNTQLQQVANGSPSGAVIALKGNSDRCHVHGNTGRKTTIGGAPAADYFVSIGASCDRTKAWGNDGYGTWAVAAVLDSGTNTDLTTVNR